MASRIVFVGMSQEIQGLKWDFTGTVRIGRQPALDLVLQHPSVHRQHAEVCCTPRGWMVRDLSQAAGSTLVNGLAVSQTPRRLQKKDVLQCGKLELRVSELEENAPPAAPAAKGPAAIKTTGPIVCIQALSQRSWEEGLHEGKRDQAAVQQGEQFLTLLQGGYYLARIHNVADFFQTFLDDTLAILDAQRAALLLVGDADLELQLRTVSLSKGLAASQRCYSATLARRCFFKGESILCQDVALAKYEDGSQSGTFSDIGSILCMVLRTPRRKLGILYLDRGPLQEPFTQDSFALAEAIVASISAAMESALTIEKQHSLLLQQRAGLAKLLVGMMDVNLVQRAERVSEYASQIGAELRLEPDEKQQLGLAALLLDLGKAAGPLPGEVGHRPPGPSGPQENHAVRAAKALSAIPGLEELAPYVRGQQEKWNGSGSPDGLAEYDIPRLARILAVARCLAEQLPSESGQASLVTNDVLAWFKARARTDFDPECVEALSTMITRR